MGSVCLEAPSAIILQSSLRWVGVLSCRSPWDFWDEKSIYLTQSLYRKYYQNHLVVWIKDKGKFSVLQKSGTWACDQGLIQSLKAFQLNLQRKVEAPQRPVIVPACWRTLVSSDWVLLENQELIQQGHLSLTRLHSSLSMWHLKHRTDPLCSDYMAGSRILSQITGGLRGFQIPCKILVLKST